MADARRAEVSSGRSERCNGRVDAEWIAKEFALGTVVAYEPIARGAMGQVHRLATAGGTFAVKEHFGAEPQDLHAEFSAAFAGRCRAQGVEAPEQVRSVAGQLVVTDDTGRCFQVSRWVPGTAVDAHDIESAVWLGDQLGRIHRLRQAPEWAAQLDPFYARCDTDWTHLVDDAGRAGAEFAEALQRVAPRFRELRDWANSAPIGELLISHNDVTLANVLRDGSCRFLVDWDNVGPQDPSRELGVLLFSWRDEPEQVGHIAAAYRAAGGPPFVGDQGLFASAITIWLNFTTVLVRQALSPRESQHHAFALARLALLLVELPSVDALGDIAEQAERRCRV